MDCAWPDVNASYAPRLPPPPPPIDMDWSASRHRVAIVLIVGVFCMQRCPRGSKFSVSMMLVEPRHSFGFLNSIAFLL